MSRICVASALRDRYPGIFAKIEQAIENAGHELLVVDSTNIWIRDWMPIKCGNRYVKFEMKADVEKWPHLAVPDSAWSFLAPVVPSEIILDGGNVVRSPDGRRVVMTEQTRQDNLATPFTCLPEQLETLLGAEIIWIPPEPGDDLGHSDGIVQWIDDRTVFLNDYRNEYGEILAGIFVEHGIRTVPFPWLADRMPEWTEKQFRALFPAGDDWNPGWGYYINYLRLDSAVLCPTFGELVYDQYAIELLANTFACPVAPIDCSRLSLEGGLVHCVTWEV